MKQRHWNDDELIARLYGVGPPDGHLEECEDCAGRWRRLLAARQRLLRPPEVSEKRMALLRHAINRRIEEPAENWRPAFAGALATVALLFLALLLSRPAPSPEPLMAVSSAPSEAELFAEIYDTAETAEPAAVAPIHSLFEEGEQ